MTSDEKFGRIAAIGAIAAAAIVGGVLFALYPNNYGYGGGNNQNGQNSNGGQSYSASPEQTSTAGQNVTSPSEQNSTSVNSQNGTYRAPSGSGY